MTQPLVCHSLESSPFALHAQTSPSGGSPSHSILEERGITTVKGAARFETRNFSLVEETIKSMLTTAPPNTLPPGSGLAGGGDAEG